MAITVTKKDGSKVSHSNASHAEGVGGELFLLSEHNQPVGSYGNGEWDSWKHDSEDEK